MMCYDDGPSGWQMMKGAAYGVLVFPDMSYWEVRELIDQAKKEMGGDRPTWGQLQVAKVLGLELPASLDAWDCYDFLIDYMHVRTWVYSVIKHIAKAKWRRYEECEEECGVSESGVAQISLELMKNEQLTAVVRHRDLRADSRSSAPWYRISPNDNQSPEYSFVYGCLDIRDNTATD